MGTREADGCCDGEQTAMPFRDRLQVGRRRRMLVRRVLLAGSAVFAVAAVVLTLTGPPVPAWLASRLAWAASVWAAGLVTGWLRLALTGRRPGWRLAASGAAVVAGIMWQPLVPALVAVLLLAEHVLRGSRSGAGAVDHRVAHPVDQPG
jgi:hypothetical protein